MWKGSRSAIRKRQSVVSQFELRHYPAVSESCFFSKVSELSLTTLHWPRVASGEGKSQSSLMSPFGPNRALISVKLVGRGARDRCPDPQILSAPARLGRVS
jgi:hypothetical protein